MEENNKVWVVISEWSLEDHDSYGSTVHGVFKDYNKAKKVFLDEASKLMKSWNQWIQILKKMLIAMLFGI